MIFSTIQILTSPKLLKRTLTDIFDCVAKDEPVYFHCYAGADRTGTIALILEALLGMSQSDIDKDYELTCFTTELLQMNLQDVEMKMIGLV